MKNKPSPTDPEAQSTPLRLDRKTLTLWKTLYSTTIAEKEWSAFLIELRRLARSFRDLARVRQSALGDILEDPAGLFRDLVESCEIQGGVLHDLVDELGWEFAGYAYGLHRHDQIQKHKPSRGRMTAECLRCASHKVGDLVLQGRILKKVETMRRSFTWLRLLETQWTQLPPTK